MISIPSRVNILRRLILSADSTALELCAAIAGLLWGAWSLSHPPLYFIASSFYRAMSVLFRERAGVAFVVCGIIALLLGLAIVAAMLIRTPRYRRVLMLCGVVFWSFVTIAAWMSTPVVVAVALYPLPALICALSYTHLRLERP